VAATFTAVISTDAGAIRRKLQFTSREQKDKKVYSFEQGIIFSVGK
jgi:hypothetical protein